MPVASSAIIPTGNTGTGTMSTTGGNVQSDDSMVTGKEANAAAVVVCDICLPPVGVALATRNPLETVINFGLWCLGIIPGVAHALIVSFSDARCSKTCGVDDPSMMAGSSTVPSRAPQSVTTTSTMQQQGPPY
jgi:uncharacterized membrane protein YqaE (UPF0057 family)